MKIDNFAVFILTNGRANNVVTYNVLKKHGYTGKIYLLVDDEDKQQNEYIKKYGEEVIIFNKQKAIEMTDSGDCLKKRNSVVYARNYSFKVAENLGIQYFLQLDDDYTMFAYTFNQNLSYITQNRTIKNLDKIFTYVLEFFIKTKQITTVAFAQGGDFIGGEGSKVAKLGMQGLMSRKVMNSFFCDTERPFKFFGRINEDVNLYTNQGLKGKLFVTLPMIRLEQTYTQANKGGLTDIYLDLGTYVKSFYSIMYAPSCVKITEMGVSDKRLHHKVQWKKTTPCIISQI
jgi:hypothetical protein